MKVRELFENNKKDLKEYGELLGDIGFFTSLNTAMIQQDAIDDNAKKELAEMQKVFRTNKILNGMTFSEVYDKPTIYNNEKVIPIMLKFAYDLIKYIEPRIIKFVKQDKQEKYLKRLNSIKDKYKKQVSYLK